MNTIDAMKQALDALEHISKLGCDHTNGLCACEYRAAAGTLRAAIELMEKQDLINLRQRCADAALHASIKHPQQDVRDACYNAVMGVEI